MLLREFEIDSGKTSLIRSIRRVLHPVFRSNKYSVFGVVSGCSKLALADPFFLEVQWIDHPLVLI